MESATPLVRPTAANRLVACLWCHEATTQADVMRNHGLCRRCVHDNYEISWRLIYDRDRNIGSIPSNLRAAYGL
ncbi:MAG: hypothetical protein ACREQH_13835 [Candidatus Binatus sp.]